MTRFGDGLALGHDLVTAAEAAVGQATAPLDGPPDLAFVFIAGPDPYEIETAARRAMEIADTPNVIGCRVAGLIGGDRGVHDEGGVSGVSAWAAQLPEARIEPFTLDTLRTTEQLVVAGLPNAQDDDVVAVLLADPFSFPVDAFVERSAEVLPGLPLVGGMVSGASSAGDARLFAGGEVLDSGAVGVLLGGSLMATTVVSQGCRPIGPNMAVTRAEENVLYELAGVPALTKLEQVVGELPDEDRRLIEGGLLIGVAMDEYAHEHDQGDFLVRGVVGADAEAGALGIADVVDVGRTVRFQVRDASAADEDLCVLLDELDLAPVEGALLFSCTGRGGTMFSSADHDVRTVRGMLDRPATAGFFAAGEIGPVGGRNHVHSFTASILVFGPPARMSG